MNASQPPVEAGLPDVLGTKFSDNEIYDFLGLHVAFSAERRGEEHVFRVSVQNNWSAARHVTFAVSPERQSGAKPKLKGATTEADVAPGEVGCLELVMPIPQEAFGRYRFHYSLQSRGSGATRCRSLRRPPLPRRVKTSDRILLALGAGLLFAAIVANKNSDGVFGEMQIEAAKITARLPMAYVVWNVAGEAPVYVEEVHYGSSAEPDGRFFSTCSTCTIPVMTVKTSVRSDRTRRRRRAASLRFRRWRSASAHPRSRAPSPSAARHRPSC